jgi:hypothetical protein
MARLKESVLVGLSSCTFPSVGVLVAQIRIGQTLSRNGSLLEKDSTALHIVYGTC